MRALAIVALLGALGAPAAAQTEPDAGVDSVEGSSGEPSGEAGTAGAGPSSTGTGTSPTSTSATAGTSATSTGTPGATMTTTSSSAGSSGTYEHAAGTGTMSASRAAPSPYYRERDDGDDEEDEGDPYDFLWIELMGGYSYVDLRAIRVDNFFPTFVRLRGDGPMGGGAVGFRIEFLSVGVRAAVAHYDDDFDVGTATAEVTLAIPIPIVKPFLRAGFGLGWHGISNFMAPEMSQTTVFGWAFSGAVGADIYFAHWFALGVAGTIDILNMSRQSIDEPVTAPGDVSFEDTGDAVGIQARAHIAASFHF